MTAGRGGPRWNARPRVLSGQLRLGQGVRPQRHGRRARSLLVKVWVRWGNESPPGESAGRFPTLGVWRAAPKGLRAWMLLSRPRGAREYSVLQPGTGCPREPAGCPGNSTAVQHTQSRGYGLTETAARLRFCTSRQGLPSRPVLNLAVPLATQHCEMLTFSSSRVPSGTRPAK